jgi:uncharacterized protein
VLERRGGDDHAHPARSRSRAHAAEPNHAQTIAKDPGMTGTGDAQTEVNRQSMIATFEAWRDGAEPFPDTWATDMVWRLEGHSIASREYASKHEYVEEFVKPFGARFLPSQRFRPTNIRSVHADGDTVIVLWDGRGIAIDGKPYENTYAFFMQMRDGKVVDVTALTDSISLNELLERVQPAGHVDP